MNTRALGTYLAIRKAVLLRGGGADLATLAADANTAKSSASKYLRALQHLEPGLLEVAPVPEDKLLDYKLPAPCYMKLRWIDPDKAKVGYYEFRLWRRGAPKPELYVPTEDAPREVPPPAAEPPSATAAVPEPVQAEEPEEVEVEDEAPPRSDKAALVEQLLRALSEPTVDEEKLRQLVREEVERLGHGKIVIEAKGRQHVIDGRGKHRLLPKALRVLDATGLLCLVGPAGSGKTTLGSHVAAALDQRFFAYSCTQGMSEGKLEGRLGFDNIFLGTPFVDFYENGGVIMLDEFDALNDNVRLVINNAIANGHMAVPNRVDNPEAKRHPDFYMVIGMNTWGQGSNGSYTGRDTIDLATRDRFAMSKLYIDYDRDIELGIEGLGSWQPISTSSTWEAPRYSMSLGSVLERVRSNIETQRIPGRVLSTRNKVDAAKLTKAGFEPNEILGIYFADWAETDRTRALQGVA